MSFEALIVLDFNVETPDDIVKILKQLDPTKLPFFGGHARIVVGEDVTDTVTFLDGENNVSVDP